MDSYLLRRKKKGFNFPHWRIQIHSQLICRWEVIFRFRSLRTRSRRRIELRLCRIARWAPGGGFFFPESGFFYAFCLISIRHFY